MNLSREHTILIGTALSGLAIWIFISSLTAKHEPWDSDLFWTIGVPAMFGINAVAAFIDPRNIIAKGLVSVSLQPIAMVLKAGEIGSMFPLGLILFGFLGLFYSVGGRLGSFLKKKLSS